MSSFDRDADIIDIERLVYATGLREHAEAWQRIRQRLTPDRERVARALYDEDLLPGDVYDWDDATLEDRNYWRAKADAAIAAMGETP